MIARGEIPDGEALQSVGFVPALRDILNAHRNDVQELQEAAAGKHEATDVLFALHRMYGRFGYELIIPVDPVYVQGQPVAILSIELGKRVPLPEKVIQLFGSGNAPIGVRSVLINPFTIEPNQLHRFAFNGEMGGKNFTYFYHHHIKLTQ